MRRLTLLLVVLTMLVGALSIDAVERYRGSLQAWLLSDPDQLIHRLRLLVFGAGSVLSVPLLAFALFLWSVGARVVAAREFPLPGQRVVRDTPVQRGAPAIFRGRLLKALALCLAVAALAWWLVLVRLAGALAARLA